MNSIGLKGAAIFLAFVGSMANAGVPTIVLDTGHTPQRPGSMSPTGRPEYEFNLRLSTYVADHLSKRGINVIRVAADGKEIALNQRTVATEGVALFVSIHHDSMQQEWIDQGRRREFWGYSAFVSERNPYYGASLACARQIGAKMRGAGERPSLYHATPIKGENRPLLDRDLGVHRFDDLVVLRTAKSPAVLVEVGVIANPDEEIRLQNADVAQRLGSAIASAIGECVRRRD